MHPFRDSIVTFRGGLVPSVYPEIQNSETRNPLLLSETVLKCIGYRATGNCDYKIDE